ncbi:MAG: hypothetical protein AAFP79_09420 [Pseudomonadota bacterium]
MFELLASDYRFALQDVLTYAICVSALIWGAGPERATVAIWMVLFELPGWFYSAIWGSSFQFQSIDFFLASSDVLAGILWVWVALYANRNYPLVIAALQLLAISAHLARGVLEAIAPVAYAAMFIAPGWLQLIVMAVGLGRHVRREQRFGPYREWRVSLPWLGWLSTKIRRA